MIKLLKKIKNILKNKVREHREESRFLEVKRKTIKLRQQKKSDIDRWSNKNELLENWNERTAILGDKISERASVIEFGAGNLALKNYLPKNCTYQASDLISRNDNILACDLNKDIEIDLSEYNTVVFSGVLEYVYDIEKIFQQFPETITTVILSYACSNISSAPRLKLGWLSDYTKEELESIFKSNNYLVEDYSEWRKQSIFHLSKTI